MLFKKIIAYLIDFVIMSIFAFIFFNAYRLFMYSNQTRNGYFMLISFVITLFFFSSYLPMKTGNTIGMKAVRIKVESTNGKPMNYWRYFLREGVLKYSLASVFVPMMIIYHLIFNVVVHRNFNGELPHDVFLHTRLKRY